MHAQLRIDHGVRVDAHLASADDVVHGLRLLANVLLHLCRGLHGLAQHHFPFGLFAEGGAARIFRIQRRPAIDKPGTREFCLDCGTHLLTRSQHVQGLIVLKRRTLDQPAAFGNPQLAIFTCDKQPWHHIPEGLPSFNKRPG